MISSAVEFISSPNVADDSVPAETIAELKDADNLHLLEEVRANGSPTSSRLAKRVLRAVQCRNKHPIEKRKEFVHWYQFGRQFQESACDVCGVVIDNRTVRWRCYHSCDTDICDACFRQAIDDANELWPTEGRFSGDSFDLADCELSIETQPGDDGNCNSRSRTTTAMSHSMSRCSRATTRRGTVRLRLGDLLGSVDDCTEAIRLGSVASQPQLFLHRAEARLKACDVAGAVLDFDECLRLQPSAAFALMGRGGARVKLDDIAGACTDFLAASKLRPQDTVDHLDYEEGFKQRPPKERARLLALRGELLKNRGREVDLQDSLEYFTEALKLGGADTPTYRSRAEVKSLLGDTEGALADLNAGLAGFPSCATTMRSRADLKMRCGDKVGALEDLDVLIRTWPEDLSASLARGDLRRALGDLSGAIADYNAALRIDPNCKLAAQGKRLAASRMTLRESVARTSRSVSMVVDLDQVFDEDVDEELAGEEY